MATIMPGYYMVRPCTAWDCMYWMAVVLYSKLHEYALYKQKPQQYAQQMWKCKEIVYFEVINWRLQFLTSCFHEK